MLPGAHSALVINVKYIKIQANYDKYVLKDEDYIDTTLHVTSRTCQKASELDMEDKQYAPTKEAKQVLARGNC